MASLGYNYTIVDFHDGYKRCCIFRLYVFMFSLQQRQDLESDFDCCKYLMCGVPFNGRKHCIQQGTEQPVVVW